MRLPVELHENILRRVPVPSLKRARLTCKQWAAVGARCLFRRVYFAPRQDVIEIFLEITGNRAFASNIEEMVYDARLFWSYLEDAQIYAEWLKDFEHFDCHDYKNFDDYDFSGFDDYNFGHYVLRDMEDEPVATTAISAKQKRHETGESLKLVFKKRSSHAS